MEKPHQPRAGRRSPKTPPPAGPQGNGAAGPLLDRAGILDSEDLESDTVPVPQWKGSVRVRALSAAERLAYDKRIDKLREGGKLDTDGNMKVIVLLFIATAVGGDGRPLFTEDDLPALMGKNFDALTAVFKKALVLNGMRDEDIEDLAGN